MLRNDSLNLSRLKDLSVHIGSDINLIQATGGNISFKNSKILWVKASGKKLKNAKVENIFVPINLSSVISNNKFYPLILIQ